MSVTADTVSVISVEQPRLVLELQAAARGPAGPRGPAGDAASVVAASILSGHRVIATNDQGLGILAQPGDASALSVQGVSTQAAIEGGDVLLQRYGPLDWPAGGLTPGAPLFLATDGHLSLTPPSTGWIRQIAVALSDTRINIDIGPAYRVGD